MQLELETDPQRWLILEQIGSTNSFLLDSVFPSGTVCLAHSQTAGRGRQGRSWASFSGHSFLFSGLLCVPTDSLPTTCLPLLTGVAVIAALRSHIQDHAHLLAEKQGTARLQLKWPNDIYLLREGPRARAAKLGGILMEGQTNNSEGFPFQRIVLGVGINWSGSENELASQIHASDEKATVGPAVLYKNTAETLLPPEPLSFMPYLIAALNVRLQQWQQKDFGFLEEARRDFYLSGRQLRYQDRFYRVQGLSASGGLLLEDIASGNYKELYTEDERFEILP